MNNEQPKQVEMKNWFADESVVTRMKAMTDNDMKALFLSLVEKPEWIAILRYAQGRISVAQSGLFTLDPFKDQTQMARYQGILTGILDLPDAVGQLIRSTENLNTPTV